MKNVARTMAQEGGGRSTSRRIPGCSQTEERQKAWHDARYMTGQTLAVDGGFTAAGLRVKQV